MVTKKKQEFSGAPGTEQPGPHHKYCGPLKSTTGRIEDHKGGWGESMQQTF
jgi:hypothetical protein